MLPTCRVHCAIFDNDGAPIEGAAVTAALNRFEVYQGYVVPDIETATPTRPYRPAPTASRATVAGTGRAG